MKITVEYLTQLRRLAGRDSDVFAFDDAPDTHVLVRRVAEKYDEPLATVLLDSQGALQPTILMSVNDEQVTWKAPRTLKDGDTVVFMSPIAGG